MSSTGSFGRERPPLGSIHDGAKETRRATLFFDRERDHRHGSKALRVVSVNCPTCGSRVSFRGEFSTHAVCGSCDSLLVRQGARVDQIGKVAELQPDGSPLRVGTQGQYDGRSFEVLGRIQLAYGDGYWNEWYLLYADGQTGWLGEAMGEYFINTQAKTSGGLPSASDLAPGDGLSLGGVAYVTMSVITNRVVSFEGELPFVVETQSDFQTADLRSAEGKAATIDYSESPPLLFLGEYRPFQDFAFRGLRQDGEGDDEGAASSLASEGVSHFNCPTCAAPHTVSGGVRSKVLVCEYCGSAVDISNPKLEIMWREERMREEVQRGVSLPLGSQARVDAEVFTLIGLLKKSVTYEGIKYPWVEYLLYHRLRGYRWLVESDGHFTWMEPVAGLPMRGSQPVTRPDECNLTYEGRTYRHFQTSNPRVDAVAGEFYWRVRAREEATNFDYVGPPHLLSLEISENGFVWSHGRYLEHEEVQAMFGLTKRLRPAMGVAPAQPNPYDSSFRAIWRTFWVALVAGMALMVFGLPGGSKTVWATSNAIYSGPAHFQPQESEPFTVSGRGNLAYEFLGNVKGQWLFFDTSLVDATTNQVVQKVGATVENYGDDSGRRRTVRMAGVPQGQYKLRWNVRFGSRSEVPDKPDPKVPALSIFYSITLKRGVPVWGWYVLMMFLLIPIPLFESARRSSFETKRWYSSDHS